MDIHFKNYTHLSRSENEELLTIRNSDNIRKNSKDDKVILIEEHLNWLESLKSTTDSLYYAIIVDGEMVGGVNAFRMDVKSAYWGVFFKDNLNPLISPVAVYLFIDKMFKRRGFRLLNSEVNINNAGAASFNTSLGFLHSSYFDENGIRYAHFTLLKSDWEDGKSRKNTIKNIAKQLLKINFKFST